MGFLKEFGKGLGQVVGTVTGEPIKWAGRKVSENYNEGVGNWISDVGKGVKSSTEFTGERLGETASGIYGLAEGTIKKDSTKQSEAFKDLSDGVGKTAKGVGQSLKNTASSVGDVAGGVIDGDEKRWKQGLSSISKTAAVGLIGLSALDAVDVIDVDGSEDNSVNQGHTSISAHGNVSEELENGSKENYVEVDNPNTHHVDPHYVEGYFRDGEWVEGYWRDGDGNTDINTYDGYQQSNPNYRIPKNEA